jgi:hypothetical protein
MSHYSEAREANWPTDDRINNIAQNGATGEHYMKELEEYVAAIEDKLLEPKVSKYHKKIRNHGVTVDVYDVLDAYGVENPAVAHAVKKMLMAGQRGYKDFQQDIQEAIDSLERAKDFPPLPF